MGDRNPGCELGENKINYYGSFFHIKISHFAILWKAIDIAYYKHCCENLKSRQCVVLVQLEQR
jgi:hypothetical protein